MAHPMYKIDALLKKYPLVEKAFNRTASEIEAAVFFLGGEKAVIETPKRIIETVEKSIDGTDAEKQALMIGVMYSMSPEALAEDRENFESEYGLAAQAIIEDWCADDKVSVASTNVARVATVLGLCQMAIAAPMFAESARSMPAQMIQETKSAALKEEARILPNLNAPKLQAQHDETKELIFKLLDGAASQPESKEQPRKKNGAPKL